MDEIELIFKTEGMVVRKKERTFFRAERWKWIDVESISYEEIDGFDRINLTIDKIEPEIERGVLRCLRFHVTDYSRIMEDRNGINGIEIRGNPISCRYAKDILIETANWLIDKNLLRYAPVDVGGFKRYLINTKPVHKDATPFIEPKELKNGMFIETNLSRSACVTNAKLLMDRCGLSKDDLKVITEMISTEKRDEVKLLFTNDGIAMQKRVRPIIKRENWKWVDVESISYEEIRESDRIKLTVDKIEPEIERGVLKSLTFHVTDYSTSPAEGIKVKLIKEGIEVPHPLPPKPTRMWIDNDAFLISNWNEILTNTAEWLIKQGKVRRDQCPILAMQKISLIDIELKPGVDEKHYKSLSNGLFMYVNYSSDDCIKRAKQLLQKYNYQGDLLKVQ